MWPNSASSDRTHAMCRSMFGMFGGWVARNGKRGCQRKQSLCSEGGRGGDRARKAEADRG